MRSLLPSFQRDQRDQAISTYNRESHPRGRNSIDRYRVLDHQMNHAGKCRVSETKNINIDQIMKHGNDSLPLSCTSLSMSPPQEVQVLQLANFVLCRSRVGVDQRRSKWWGRNAAGQFLIVQIDQDKILLTSIVTARLLPGRTTTQCSGYFKELHQTEIARTITIEHEAASLRIDDVGKSCFR
jgi:hypothetical protein